MEQPVGTVTLVFTDIEGSTRLLRELGPAYRGAIAEHRSIVRESFTGRGGYEVDNEGDSFFYAFPAAQAAVAAVAEAMRGLEGGPIRIRVGIHTGEPGLDPPKYVGLDVHRAARIMAAGHGGQVVISQSTRDLLDESFALRDLGEHRLKDLGVPQRLYQLQTDGLPDEFPPLRTLYRTNLPVPVTSFLGRERELSDVVGLLTRRDVRLLTLTGPGGTGKTRLAVQAAAELAERYPDGVWWVPLAPLRDPQLVLASAAQTLDAKIALTDHIGDKTMLLLFDNFEQVVEAAPGLAELLAACSNLHLLVTSREPLHISGEQEYPVAPLVHEEGVGFFLARARAVEPDFQADNNVSEICRRLDDLPLALELAAARVKALSSAQILERLERRLPLLTGGPRDLPERQRTLRATIGWSYGLLTPEEQRLFARLSVFSGGCTLEAAQDVTEADLDTLQSLVDKSLVRHTQERFWMLETIREYAAERLEENGEAEAIRLRHADRCVAFGKARYDLVRDGDREATAELAAEVDNFRAVLDWAAATDQPQYTCSAGSALWFFWVTRGHLLEAEQWARRVIADADRLPTKEGVEGLVYASDVIKYRDPVEAVRVKELAIASLDEEHPYFAATLSDLAGLAAQLGDFPKARTLAKESLARRRKAGRPVSIAHALSGWAWVEFLAGDFERARLLWQEALALPDAERDSENHELMVGACARRLGDAGEARIRLRRGLELIAAHEMVSDLPEALQEVGAVLLVDRKAGCAATIFGAAERLLAEVGMPRTSQVDYERQLELLRAALSPAEIEAAWEAGGQMSTGAAVDYALDSLADAAATQ